MILFTCPSCKAEFEECLDTADIEALEQKCPECGTPSRETEDFTKKIHRPGARYRDVSWSTWAVGS